jgi:hypothetical protein
MTNKRFERMALAIAATYTDTDTDRGLHRNACLLVDAVRERNDRLRLADEMASKIDWYLDDIPAAASPRWRQLVNSIEAYRKAQDKGDER